MCCDLATFTIALSPPLATSAAVAAAAAAAGEVDADDSVGVVVLVVATRIDDVPTAAGTLLVNVDFPFADNFAFVVPETPLGVETAGLVDAGFVTDADLSFVVDTTGDADFTTIVFVPAAVGGDTFVVGGVPVAAFAVPALINTGFGAAGAIVTDAGFDATVFGAICFVVLVTATPTFFVGTGFPAAPDMMSGGGGGGGVGVVVGRWSVVV